MRKHVLPLLLVVLVLAGIASAQDAPPAGPPPDDRRPNLLAELNLTPDQVQQIKQINQSRRPILQQAQRRLRDANRALDVAIYADSANDADFAARLREFQAAQADLARLRFENELAVRKLLTPEQLTKFRNLRQRFEEQMQKLRRSRPPGRPGEGPQGPPDDH